ncbi:membrane protein [Pseudonocardia sulfidoxydans NBRC 16205]|uniref:Membrane protein n=1 Tax=Pseudonocardia sulfidoxydans NBRC 16205 TaxID=1223511 RepID=A0A511DID3_9PSEU|nr:neutral zinc metallopeptidase [Pseudonocardia sulfidoxydans]GEL24073.1 membrane protein [Pseudonocardia sulfidoxydans NBRC 16205]
MRFDENADLDTSSVDDLRGSGGRGGGGVGGRVAVGGGGLGIIGLILYFVISALGGGGTGGGGGFALPSSGLTGLQSGQQADGSAIAQSCQTGADANTRLDCEVVAVVNSLNGYWSDVFARSGQTYSVPRINFFSGSVNTGGCGSATSDVGPFYCPADQEVYIDLSFFEELETRFGAQGGPYARAYVIAHEYGHHVQNLLGTSRRVQAGDSGPTSGSVRLELQADCYAGAWGNHATQVPTSTGRPLITDVTQADVAAALDTASRIGDDYIQSNLGGGRVNESQFTHGSSAQREKWYSTGYQSGNPAQCDTFARGVSLG